MMRSFGHQRVQADPLEVEVDELRFFLGRQIADVDHHGEAVGGGFRQREGALSQLDRVHGGDGETEGGQFVGGLADRDRAILQAFEEGALRFERDAVDLVEQDDFGRGQRAELGDELAGGRVDHLEADHLGRLQVGAALDAGELGVRDGRQDHAEESLAYARDAPDEQVAGVDLPVLLLVVGGRDLRQQHDVGQGLGRFVADQGLAPFGQDGMMESNGFGEIWMHVGSWKGQILYRAGSRTIGRVVSCRYGK